MLKERFFLVTILISVVTIQLMLWSVYLNFDLLPPQIPLYYFKPWGEERLGSPAELWAIPAWMGGIFVINTFLAWRFFRREKFLAKVLVSSSALGSVMGLLFLLRILGLVLP